MKRKFNIKIRYNDITRNRVVFSNAIQRQESNKFFEPSISYIVIQVSLSNVYPV